MLSVVSVPIHLQLFSQLLTLFFNYLKVTMIVSFLVNDCRRESFNFVFITSHLVTAVHLERNVDFANTGSNGVIQRWHPQHWSPTNNSLVVESLKLEDHNSSLVIPSTGLYLIYAQVVKSYTCYFIFHVILIWICNGYFKLCYAATRDNNSYEVRVINQGATSSQSKIIAQCSAGTTIHDNDITCYTSVAQVNQF